PINILVANHSDNLAQVGLARVGEVNSFSDRVVAVEYLVHQSLIHNHDLSGFFGVLAAEEPARAKGNAHNFEVVGGYSWCARLVLFTATCFGMTFKVEARSISVTRQRHDGDRSHILNPGKGVNI